MSWYKNMKIGKKILSGFILVALTSATMGIYAEAVLNTAEADQTIFITAAVIMIALLISIIIGVLISKTITKPIKKVVYILDEMSKGHFGERLNLNTKNEIGHMTRTMDAFAEKLQEKVIFL